MSDSSLIRAAWIIPVASPPIRDGFVRIDGGRIAAVGRFDQIDPHESSELIDLGNAILTPGLVNPHTHLELSCYCGQLQPAPFWTWIRGLIELRIQPGQRERETQAVIDGAWESLRAGVTCVGDISRLNLHWRPLKAIPIRKVAFVELLSIAESPPRNPDELQDAVREVQEDELLTAGVSPHAPYSVPAGQIRAAIELATQLERPWCAHWAETREEVGFLLGRADSLPPFVAAMLARFAMLGRATIESPRLSPAAYLDQCASGLNPGALAHVNYVTDADVELLARAGHIVIYCPRAHAFFGHEPHPIARLRRAGITVAIGTDSSASNANLSILDELRFLARTQRFSPDELLEMATLNGARALRLDGQIGSLEPGKQADLAAFEIDPIPQSDPLGHLFARDCTVRGIWVAGRRVV